MCSHRFILLHKINFVIGDPATSAPGQNEVLCSRVMSLNRSSGSESVLGSPYSLCIDICGNRQRGAGVFTMSEAVLTTDIGLLCINIVSICPTRKSPQLNHDLVQVYLQMARLCERSEGAVPKHSYVPTVSVLCAHQKLNAVCRLHCYIKYFQPCPLA